MSRQKIRQTGKTLVSWRPGDGTNMSREYKLQMNDEAVDYNNIRAQLLIRTLQGQDIDRVVSLCKEAFPLEYDQNWFFEVCSGRYISYGAFDGENLAGLIVAEVKTVGNCEVEDRDMWNCLDSHVVYVMSLAVSCLYRRRGIGTVLLEYLQTVISASRPCPVLIYLHVLKENYGAITFYKNRGFKHHKTLTNYYLIDGIGREGLTFILFLNNNTNACSLKDMWNTTTAMISALFRSHVLRST
ncbi:unnamed protein product [Bursaphelenchus xylophilus]|uniref:N-alpha-acetyltransferase 60 n=1 Tax=Bursaphelenchus xylophilus TaxID=6326 RepID=A0A7I8XI54_BURXY|nr:unnamed protein product [Bursaphelenchus xylophilus]CAG9085059.1 unnamed protein product [Bursaphelenchus xylophilus]